LPLIYALLNTQGPEREKVRTLVDSKEFTPENIQFITRFAIDNGGVEYALSCMETYKNKAIDELNGFADSDVKRSLIKCAEYSASREI